MMFRRVPIHDVGSLDEVEQLLAAESGAVLIFDADNTLAPQGASLEEFGALVNGVIDRFEAVPGVARVIVLTDGAERGVPRMISRGNKPWTTRRRLGLEQTAGPIVVVGDQIVTDGVLAWRLGATFLHLVIDDENENAEQARMRRMGKRLMPLLFRRSDGG